MAITQHMEINQGYCISEICLQCAVWNKTIQTVISWSNSGNKSVEISG